ncbi:ion channel activity [Perkinsus olseni]|uniref:Ion channel activity n=1 Tax=Perkinsus olseni TaxID=32597 RepID=A0A7J6SKV3_PEROL|nr:ion channel activity [Perkinsus olseni]
MGCGASSSSKPEEVVKTVPVEVHETEPKAVEEEAPAAAGNGDAGPESMRASVSNYVQRLASAATDKPADGEAAQAPAINVEGVPALAAYDANEWGKNEKDAPEESKPEENARPAVEDEEGPVDPAPSAAEENPTETAAAAVPENKEESGDEEVVEAEGKNEEPAAEEAAVAAPAEEAPAAVEEGGEVVELYVGGDGGWEEDDGDLSTKEGCRSDDFFVWRDLEIEIAPLGEEEEDRRSLTTKAWLGAAFLSACTVKLAAPMTAMNFAGGAVAAAPMALVQSSFIPSISPSLSTLYMNLPSVGMALTWVAASFTVPNIIMAATAYVMVKASFGFIRRGRSVPVGSGRPVYYIAAAVTATTACGYLAQLLALSPVFTGTTLLGHHVASLVPSKYIEWIVSSSLMLINAGLMSGAGVKAVVPALVANTIWIGGEFGSLFVITPWWAKAGLYSASLCLGVVPLIWYVGCRLRDISKSHGDRELAGRFRLIADLTVVTWSLYPVAWLVSDGLGIVKIGSTSYAIMISGLDLLSKYGGSTLVTKDHQVLDRAYGIATGHAGGKVRRARVTPVAGEGEPAVYTEPPPLLGELATAALQGEDDAESQSSGNGDE